MRKLLTGLAAAAALGLIGSAAQADCFQGHVSASAPSEETVAMSTREAPAPIVEAPTAEKASASDCPEGATCAPAEQ